jgi:hypothetical protein
MQAAHDHALLHLPQVTAGGAAQDGGRHQVTLELLHL